VRAQGGVARPLVTALMRLGLKASPENSTSGGEPSANPSRTTWTAAANRAAPGLSLGAGTEGRGAGAGTKAPESLPERVVGNDWGLRVARISEDSGGETNVWYTTNVSS